VAYALRRLFQLGRAAYRRDHDPRASSAARSDDGVAPTLALAPRTLRAMLSPLMRAIERAFDVGPQLLEQLRDVTREILPRQRRPPSS